MADFRYSSEHEALRAEVRGFLAEAMADADAHADPADLTGLAEPFERSLHRQAGARGWLRSDDPLRQSIFDFEVARADAPLVDTAMTLAGSAVELFASDHQRGALLSRMHAGEVEVCIAYSEPDAGSDLTALAATARADTDGWVLDGCKVLVTGAHKADVCLTVAITAPEAPPRKAMSMFLVPMGAPGVEVVRHETMNGWTLDEIRFQGVRLGPDALLGAREAGWRQLAAALAAERSGVFLNGFARRALDLLLDRVRGSDRAEDPLVVDAIGRLEVAWAASERLSRRALWTACSGEVDPVLGPMAKVVASELQQDIARTAMEVLGPEALAWGPLFGGDGNGRFAYEYLERVHPTIGAGANEVQRDAIARHGLGLGGSRG